MTELSFLERAGCFVAAVEETALQKFLNEATDAAIQANNWPSPQNVRKASDYHWRYADEVDRIRVWSPDQEEQYLADYAIKQLSSGKKK